MAKSSVCSRTLTLAIPSDAILTSNIRSKDVFRCLLDVRLKDPTDAHPLRTVRLPDLCATPMNLALQLYH
eukprot:scaffold207081_cov30-Tisochrysis_lutea.AAC.1